MFGVTDVTLVFGDEQCQVSQHSSAALSARVTQICKSAILATKSCGPSLICFFAFARQFDFWCVFCFSIFLFGYLLPFHNAI